MEWLYHRTGALGKRRSRILRRLSSILAADRARNHYTVPELIKPGLKPEALNQLAMNYRFEELARAFPARGELGSLREIASFGAAFADFAHPSGAPDRLSVLTEGALFNVGIALFDTVVDSAPHRTESLVEALAPEKIKKLILHPLDPSTRLFSNDHSVNHICLLFGHVFKSIGLRLAGQDPKLENLIECISEMYESETQKGANRFDAKSFPIAFICTASSAATKTSSLFGSVGRLIALFDDWLDFPEDLMAGRANSFIYPYDMDATRAPIYAACATYRVIFSGRLITRLESGLSDSLEEVLRLARPLPVENRLRLGWIIHRMVGDA